MSSSPNSSSSSEPPITPASLTVLHDVMCSVDVVLGTTSMTVRDCLHLRSQSIVRLIQPAGADMTVSVNGVSIAHGEVVIVEDSTALRVTDILAPPSSEVHE